jgi:catechol 2,3-dioxygenase-like lactoylglutathione lyase family enzyme
LTKLATMIVNPIPDGYTSLTPFLCVDGAAAAIDFYIAVFGAKLVDRMDGQGGTVAHATRWTVMTRVEDVSPRERDRRLAEWATENV